MIPGRYIRNYCSLLIVLTLFLAPCFAQNVGINSDGSLPDANAMLDIKSGNKGILIPRMDSNTRKSIPNTIGLLVYDSTTHSFWYNNGTDWQNISTGSGWTLSGNAVTTGSHFLGTTNFEPLLIKVANNPSGLIDPHASVGNTFWGFGTGVAITTGTSNTATGFTALEKNTTGNDNTATGSQALHSNATGDGNVAFGYQALSSNIGGVRNTATGYRSLLFNTTGSVNVANGENALQSNITGHHNAAYGGASLYGNSTGAHNTAVGDFALNFNTTGSFNTAIGSNAGVNALNLTNATAIGSDVVVDASNKVRIGNAAVTVIEGQVPFTTPSDGRFKYNIQQNVKGLDFILKLRPVTYQFDVQRYDASMRSNEIKTGRQPAWPGGSAEARSGEQEEVRLEKIRQASFNEATQIRRTGFIAQEVEKAAIAAGYNFSGIIKPKTDKEYYSISYESFVVPLVKAVQEQQQVIDAQNKKNENQLTMIDELNKKMEAQEKKFSILQQQIEELGKLINATKIK